MKQKNIKVLITLLCIMAGAAAATSQSSPNVILVMTDDQGIGDLGAHGNPWIKTPHMDQFYQESVRLTDFHVSPLCTPTRAAIMTGRYPINNGTWATFKGRDAMSSPLTMADIFRQNGYKTGMFGKWHLGDNYPNRPTDSGFDLSVQHLAGGVGELSDYWGNSYFDDVYYVNNEPKQFKGYCTDIWFDEAIKFMKAHKEEPFFVYLPTNAPHDPLIVDEKYASPYKHLEGHEIVSANLYGMIANIDENFGKLRDFLKKNELEDNTILIFMTDNGTRFGYDPHKNLGYNKGFNGIKGDKLEGGHRVPFFIRWPKARIIGGKDVNMLTAHVDLIPTLAGLCKLTVPEDAPLDGIDFSPLLLDQKRKLNDRSVFIHHRQDWQPPFDIDQSCIMKEKWRLLNGSRLYDMEKDPRQQNNLADAYPKLVEQMLKENTDFLQKAKTNREYHELPVTVVGHNAQSEIKLTIQHAIGDDSGIWKPEQVASGVKNKNNTHALEIEEEGTYAISCRRWPKECPGRVLGIPKTDSKNGRYEYKPIAPQTVRIQIANQLLEKNIGPKDEAVTFTVRLDKGKTFLVNDFIQGPEKYGVYYTYIRKIE